MAAVAVAANQICQIACTTCRQVGGASRCRRRKAKGAEKVTRLSGCQNDSKRFHLASMLNSMRSTARSTAISITLPLPLLSALHLVSFVFGHI